MNSTEVCVPESALSMEAEEGGAISPEGGDEVEVTLRGPVTRREGGNVYFTPTMANGQPMPAAESQSPDMPSEDAAMDAEIAKYREEATL